jgi:hypothetical protein
MTSRVIISLRTRRSWSDGNPVTVRPSETPGQPPRHPAAREHDVDVDDDRHHTTSSSSRRSIVALRNRPRMTTISNANAAPPMATPQPIRTSPGASSISPTCAQCSNDDRGDESSEGDNTNPAERALVEDRATPHHGEEHPQRGEHNLHACQGGNAEHRVGHGKEWHLRFCDRRAAPEQSQSAESGSCPHRSA